MAAAPEFFIPQDPSDLESPPPGHYGVLSVSSFDGEAAPVDDTIESLSDTLLNADDPLAAVLDHAVFDKAYSLIKCVCADYSARGCCPVRPPSRNRAAGAPAYTPAARPRP